MTNIKVKRWFIIIFMLAILVAFIFFGALCSNQTMKIFFVGEAFKSMKEDIYNAENPIVKPNPTIFLGDSITEMYDLDRNFKGYGIDNIINRGVSSETSYEVLDRLTTNVISLEPKRVILLIGTNDLNKGVTPDEIVDNILKIVTHIRRFNDKTDVYVESILPVNNKAYMLSKSIVNHRDNKDIDAINSCLLEVAPFYHFTYVDTNSKLKDKDGNLKKEYSVDGLHISRAGYTIMTEVIANAIKDNDSNK